MTRIIIDNQTIECREGISVLQAALEAGWDIPHYCYHPGLSVVASCRLCLMDMQMPHPKTREMDWSPKLVPSCQTPVRDGLIVRFDSEKVRKNQAASMEFFLLNHPLDCPVCDQAGECYLQDYSLKFGAAQSRMIDQKLVNAKKDIGPKTLLYSDRCVMCTRCVRFAQEISGTHELGVVHRGSRCEIDAFPGRPLDNPLQGNVVDICPVGALLDKDFLFRRRVWELRGTRSVCPGCATGCSICVDHADGRVYRIKPRYNPKVNDWWICDQGRFGFKYVHSAERLTAPRVRRGQDRTVPTWEELIPIVRIRIEEHVRRHGGERFVAMLSPFLACEEAWLLIRFLRDVAPKCALAIGPVPSEAKDIQFPVGATGDAVKFTISKERCPNRRGIEMVLDAAGGTTLSCAEFAERAGAGEFSGCWIAAGYPESWVDKETAKLAKKFEFLVVQDLFENELTNQAAIVLPACAWVEREGSFVNQAGLIQLFERAVQPPDGLRQDGQLLYELAGFEGLYSAARVRELMAATIPAMAETCQVPPAAVYAH